MAKLNTSTSIVDALKASGADSSYANRKKLAEANGISNYTGTAEQNTQLLNSLKSGTLNGVSSSVASGAVAGASAGVGASTGNGTSPSGISALNSKYSESQAVIDARNAMNAHNTNRVADWTGGTYGQALQNAMDAITNREKFSYDLNGDALYQQYKDKYINQGRLAMQDTIGQASAMTGGYGNSYAATAGNQAYQGYLQQLNDVVPELYQLAYDKYNKEGEDLYNQYSMYNNAYNTEYGQYRDQVADWNTEAERLANSYYNEANMDFSRYTSDRDYNFSVYQQGVAESQFAQNLALQKAQLEAKSSSGGSSGGSSGSGGNGGSGGTFTVKSDAEYVADAKKNQKTQKQLSYTTQSYYTQVANDIKSMDKNTAKEYIKTQWSNGNLTTSEYTSLYNKLRG